MPEYLISQRDSREERAEQVAAVRSVYRYNMEMGFPVAAGTTEEDGPAKRWQVKSLEAQEKLRMNLRLLKRRGRWNFVNELQPLAPLRLAAMIRSDDMAGLVDYFMPVPGGTTGEMRQKSLDEFREVFALIQPPSIVERFETDEYFAECFVAGPDPTRLHRMTAVPGKFPITSAHLTAVPGFESDDLESAIAAGRVYWVDYEAMSELDNGKHPQAPKYMYAPMAAFCVPRGGGALRPFAIQCGQDPAGRDIYTPADGYSWKLAKNCVLSAHNTYHEVLTHLGFTHLMSEPVLLAAVRNLAANHPVAVLLKRHFEGTFSINKLAVELLIQPGKAVEYLIGSDLASTYPWLAKHRANRSFRGNYLPATLAATGTAGSRELPHFPYRDDGLLVWQAISEWVGTFVGAYYRTDADVVSDHELQAWAAEVASPDGGQVRDFGATPGQVADVQDLVEILTMVIWTAGPQHAAVNFAQKDHMAFLPANPLAGYTPEPTGRGHTETDWLDNLPPLDVAVQQFCVMNFLGSIHHTVLGDYEDDFRNTPVSAGHQRFQADLGSIEAEIVARNRRRAMPYEYLRPSLIPNSTNI
ncbi:lipoxygenase family protein [Lentzea kentuckyensis]|uniref:lipoxygenase family protein n=1 Tax=Lentzea kentuckyensis TaxID=360086 RepID=UPI00130228CF|nr:lipoxygenase family protein [Lentzea kentuckyensis]